MSFRTTPLDRTQRRSGVILLAGVLVALGALGMRLVQLNTALRDPLVSSATRQQRGTAVTPARRGMILDVRGRVVAVSRRTPDVFVDPASVEDVETLAGELAARIDQPAPAIAARIRSRPASRFVVIAPRVDAVTAAAVQSLARYGVGLSQRAHRVYPLGRSMAHVLGWVGRDGHGMGGIERAYDAHLQGRSGLRVVVRDAHRRGLRPLPEATRAPADGGHVVLTLDAEIQRLTEDALEQGVEAFDAESGVAIVMSPYDGGILAMACHPAFDPNEPATAESMKRRRNRAVTDPVEPGSTFKPIIACGALERGFVTLGEQIDCHRGSYRFGSRVVTDTSPHGLLDLRGIIVRSSNIGMALIGNRMGNAVLYETLRRFGFGQRTGVECPGESAGVLYPLRRWTSYSTTSVSFGYEILVTPLQLVTAFSAILNDGILVRPRLVKRLLGPDGEVVESFDSPQVVRRAVASEVARFMRQDVLPAVVEEGGGRRARVGPYRVLGKTGTAKLLSKDRKVYEQGAYLSLFVGAAPAARPRVVALAMIRRPDRRIGYYGGKVAAPVVGRILADTLAYWEVPPDDPSGFAGG